jgi:hypothetical protein
LKGKSKEKQTTQLQILHKTGWKQGFLLTKPKPRLTARHHTKATNKNPTVDTPKLIVTPDQNTDNNNSTQTMMLPPVKKPKAQPLQMENTRKNTQEASQYHIDYINDDIYTKIIAKAFFNLESKLSNYSSKGKVTRESVENNNTQVRIHQDITLH